jgi:SAM-dependent methyltransferase
MIGLLLGAAWWWFPIHLLFFPAILLLQQLHLSPAVHLAVFLCLLVFNWGVIRTRVPLYLSRPAVWKEVEALLPAGQSYRLLDIGSGLGGMLLHLDQARPLGRHEGIEISPAPWFISRVRARLAGTRASFKCGDYRALDLSGYDVVFAFLSPLVMEALQHKASREMRPGTLLVSLAFPLPGVEHDLVIRTGSASRQALYVWRVRPVSPAPQAQTLSPTPRHQPA